MNRYIILIIFLVFYVEIFAAFPRLNGEKFHGILESVSENNKLIILSLKKNIKYKLNNNFKEFINFYNFIGREVLSTTYFRPEGPLVQLEMRDGSTRFLIGLNYQINDLKKIGSCELTYNYCLNKKACENYFLLKNDKYELRIKKDIFVSLKDIHEKGRIVFLNLKNSNPVIGLSNDFAKNSFDYLYTY